MLLYNKALDTNHTLLRIVSIIFYSEIDEFEEDKLRILDFIVAHPFYISEMSLEQSVLKIKNGFKKYKNSYSQYDAKNLFEAMRPIQIAAILSLSAVGVLERKNNSNRYKKNNLNIPESLLELIVAQENSIPHEAIEFISKHLVGLKLVGRKGLKDASKLMEHKYDAA